MRKQGEAAARSKLREAAGSVRRSAELMAELVQEPLKDHVAGAHAVEDVMKKLGTFDTMIQLAAPGR